LTSETVWTPAGDPARTSQSRNLDGDRANVSGIERIFVLCGRAATLWTLCNNRKRFSLFATARERHVALARRGRSALGSASFVANTRGDELR
jgi:hypothetical protein